MFVCVNYLFCLVPQNSRLYDFAYAVNHIVTSAGVKTCVLGKSDDFRNARGTPYEPGNRYVAILLNTKTKQLCLV